MNVIFRFYELTMTVLVVVGHIWLLSACPIKILIMFLCQQMMFQRSQMRINVYTGSYFTLTLSLGFVPVWEGL